MGRLQWKHKTHGNSWEYVFEKGGTQMADLENSKDLISVLWSGADILRSKMDANEYKDYLLGIVFYKYLSDSFLIKIKENQALM